MKTELKKQIGTIEAQIEKVDQAVDTILTWTYETAELMIQFFHMKRNHLEKKLWKLQKIY
jgi:hypothetical protein